MERDIEIGLCVEVYKTRVKVDQSSRTTHNIKVKRVAVGSMPNYTKAETQVRVSSQRRQGRAVVSG